MRETRYYDVAGHVFSVDAADSHFTQMANYEPFGCEGGDTLFALTIADGEAPLFTEEIRQDDEDQMIVCGYTADGRSVFEFCWHGVTAGWLVCAADYREGQLLTTGCQTTLAIDNALMVLYALAPADRQTLLFHSSVVNCRGRAYMFLGKSGTGKSTHSRLWLRHIEATELINDDNPVVRIQMPAEKCGGAAVITVYGSPWSGKTPCYRQVSCPLGGIVLLSQAPYNKICRMGGIEAYAALVPSISGKRWDTRIADGLHQSENILAQQVPVFHLACLPDEEAARMCCAALTNEEVS